MKPESNMRPIGEMPLIYTQADLDRAVEEARALAFESVIAGIRLDVENGDISTGAGQWIIDNILALMGTTHAEALDRLRADAEARGAADAWGAVAALAKAGTPTKGIMSIAQRNAAATCARGEG